MAGILGAIGDTIGDAASSIGKDFGSIYSGLGGLSSIGNTRVTGGQGVASPSIGIIPNANNPSISKPNPVTPSPAGPAGGDQYAALIAAQNAQNSQTQAFYSKLLAQEKANAPGTPLTAQQLNLNQLNAQAQSAANNSVNPLYTQYLNDYLQREQSNIQAATQINAQNISGEQLNLAQTQGKNLLQQQQAVSANSLQQGNINVQQHNYELQSGNAENAKLQAVQGEIGSGNLGASGLGQQQLYNAENTKNFTDAAQRGQFQYQRDTGNLSTQDTFDQLAQSSLYAGQSEQAAEKATNFSLNDYIRQAQQNDQQYQIQLEQARQQALTAQTQQSLAGLLQNAITSRTSGKDLAATEQAYGYQLHPSVGNPSAPSQSEFLPSYGGSV